ncbi:MAG: hypothetical protein N3B14_08535 [Thermoleophilia bacterium]|nr:hypothetical protein [Thermoleophilia bacterium]
MAEDVSTSQRVPRIAEYCQALVNAKYTLSDPELSGGEVILDKKGEPFVTSGNFACVFKVKNAAGKAYAVRCFHRAVYDRADRYRQIQPYLAQLGDADWKVDFRYLDEGILVNGAWYPILKMDWVEGEELDRYIASHLEDHTAIEDLFAEFLHVLGSLRDARIAHGDLHHSNVMVTKGGRIKLVDYDGMFVPTLEGRLASEVGHPNYQHPRRTVRHFDDSIDSFSALVILASLAAIASRPKLWTEYHSDGDCLIMGQRDFLSPSSSRVFRELQALGDLRVQLLVGGLLSALATPDPQACKSIAQTLLAGLWDRHGAVSQGIQQAARTKHDARGFDRRGIHRDTGTKYDPQGFDREGYDARGFDRNGIHRETGTKYDHDGFDRRGIHRETRRRYDPLGFNSEGIHCDTGTKYDPRGFDRRGIHRDTGTKYDPQGFDQQGYDARGFDRNGIHRESHTKYDPQGFDRNGIHGKVSMVTSQRITEPVSSAKGDFGQKGGESSCFVATVVFGTPLAEEVQVLRWYRDNRLLRTTHGRLAVRIYYAVGPTLARAVNKTETGQKAVRAILRSFVRRVASGASLAGTGSAQAQDYGSTPAASGAKGQGCSELEVPRAKR